MPSFRSHGPGCAPRERSLRLRHGPHCQHGRDDGPLSPPSLPSFPLHPPDPRRNRNRAQPHRRACFRSSARLPDHEPGRHYAGLGRGTFGRDPRRGADRRIHRRDRAASASATAASFRRTRRAASRPAGCSTGSTSSSSRKCRGHLITEKVYKRFMTPEQGGGAPDMDTCAGGAGQHPLPSALHRLSHPEPELALRRPNDLCGPCSGPLICRASIFWATCHGRRTKRPRPGTPGSNRCRPSGRCWPIACRESCRARSTRTWISDSTGRPAQKTLSQHAPRHSASMPAG